MYRLTAGLLTCLICVGATFALAADPLKVTVEEVNQKMEELKGQKVQLKGKVVKVNNGIMRRNFIHLQDGTGKVGTTDKVIVTSQDKVNVGDEVVVTGTVALGTDFGAGYMYPLLVEKSSVSPAK